jgi:hypothetical protein
MEIGDLFRDAYERGSKVGAWPFFAKAASSAFAN